MVEKLCNIGNLQNVRKPTSQTLIYYIHIYDSYMITFSLADPMGGGGDGIKSHPLKVSGALSPMCLIKGGQTQEGIFDRCWDGLKPCGYLFRGINVPVPFGLRKFKYTTLIALLLVAQWIERWCTSLVAQILILAVAF